MADQIKVDTDKAAQAAEKIAKYNRQIMLDFEEPEAAIKALSTSWKSTSSDNARSAFQSIKKAYHNKRYQVVEQYVAVLRRQIDDGYTQTETANKALADFFK